jgi:molecular chaperone DnaK
MIVGIDLGTTFSAVSCVGPTGTPMLFPDRMDQMRHHTPSVVHIGQGGAFVGQVVEEMLIENPALRVCRFAKSGIAAKGPLYECTQGQDWSAQAMSSLILRKLKMDAEVNGIPITRCVISVPAHFNEAEKRATINAARLADLPVVGLVEEPVAAATFAVAGSLRKEKTVFVFDLGGGTLDATILCGNDEGLYVLSTEGAPELGGRNFDEVIMELVIEQFRVKHGLDPTNDTPAMQSLRTFATRTKIELSQGRTAHVNKDFMMLGRTQRVTMSRSLFESSSAHLITACLEVCHRALRSSALSWAQIDELVLVGGGSLLPCVEQAVIRDSGLAPDHIRRTQPHAAVAYGVALMAENQFGNRENIAPPIRQSVSTNQLGLRMLDPVRKKPYFEVLIERNTPLPAIQTRNIFTSHENQDIITIEVLQRKDEQSTAETLELLNYGPVLTPGKNYPVRVALGYDKAGRVSLEVCDGRTGREISKIIHHKVQDDLANEHERVARLPILA